MEPAPQSAVPLVPLDALPETRPRLAERPCPACGTPVEPLRAGAVLVFDDGFRYLCSAACRTAFLRGERAPEARTPRREEPARAVSTTGPRAVLRDAVLTGRRRVASVLAPVPSPRAGLLCACGGAVLGLAGSVPAAAVLSMGLTWAASGLAMRAAWPARQDVGWLGWSLGPIGASLAALAGLVASLQRGEWIHLVGAAAAAACMVGRAWLDARARQPVERVVADLLAQMPSTVRVPVADAADPTGLQSVEVDAARVRTGEEVLALEGTNCAVDGVVKAGEAYVLLHPTARTPVRRAPGDPVLAGARIVEGALRVLAARVGEDRALVRPARFGSGAGPDAAPIARIADGLTRWGGIAAIASAVIGILLTDGTGFALQLSAASAVLLAAPLFAVRRAAESPLVAAGAVAAGRGLVFHSARALDRAGRVSQAALCGHGTVTEGKPEVVEVHGFDGADVPALLAVVVAAEAAAAEHPIAHAILVFAETRGIKSEPVRRATLLPGRGVTALTPSGEALVIGNRQLLLDEGVSVAIADGDAARAEARGHTAVFVGLGGHVRAILQLEDAVRPGARATVQRLIDLGIEVVLLSGDHRGTIEALARNVDVQHVKAELLPAERGAEVRKLREGGMVAVFGRPGHDDAALSAAQVPVVIGAAGGPAGERAISLASDDVRDGAAALWIARAARQGAWRAGLLTLAGGVVVVALAASAVAAPAVAAVLGLLIDAYALPNGARLLRRVALRLPSPG